MVPLAGPLRVTAVETKLACGKLSESKASLAVTSLMSSGALKLTLAVSTLTETALFSGAAGSNVMLPATLSKRP